MERMNERLDLSARKRIPSEEEISNMVERKVMEKMNQRLDLPRSSPSNRVHFPQGSLQDQSQQRPMSQQQNLLKLRQQQQQQQNLLRQQLLWDQQQVDSQAWDM